MAARSALNRREFAGLAATAAVGALGLGAAAAGAEPALPASRNRRGIWKILRNPKALESPLGMPAGEIWRYMLNNPFQVAPHLAAGYVNMKMCRGPGQDFEGGGDILLFDRPGGLRAEGAVRVSRNEKGPNPNFGNKLSWIVKYPGEVGFVPLGARLAGGRPHPHAGTGFAMVVTAAWPTDRSNGYATYPDRIGLTAYLGEKRYRTLEVHQLRYDGSRMTVSEKRILESDELAPGFHFEAGGMSCAIADGEDLIMGIKMKRVGAQGACSGVIRWRRVSGDWKPVGFEAATPEDNALEPSVVRDLDGSLLLAARSPRSMGPPLRVWRQGSPGEPWEPRINLNGMLPSTPVTLCRAADGTPFVAGNLYQPEFHLPAGLYSDGGISRLEPVGWRGERSTLCVWPLNEARDGLDAQFVARDPRVEFGLPPHGTIWALDHPMVSPVRLADGRWHALMGYRMLEWKENTHFIPPSPQTGSYLDEVVSFGPEAPLWEFEA